MANRRSQPPWQVMPSRRPSPAEVDDRNNDPLCTVGISALVCRKAGPAVVRALGVAGTSSQTFNLAEIHR
jgi:hypothetical protein